MRGKMIRRRGNAPPVLALAALLLALGVVATTPLVFTIAKYAASATAAANAKVAKWAPDLGGEMAGTQPIAIYIRRDDTDKYGDAKPSRTVVFNNSGSEVAARFNVSLDTHGYTWLGSSVPASADVAPGISAAAGSLTMSIYNWAMFDKIPFTSVGNLYAVAGRFWYSAPVRPDYGDMGGNWSPGPSPYLSLSSATATTYFVRRMNGYAPGASPAHDNLANGLRSQDILNYQVNTASCAHYFDFSWSATQVD